MSVIDWVQEPKRPAHLSVKIIIWNLGYPTKENSVNVILVLKNGSTTRPNDWLKAYHTQGLQFLMGRLLLTGKSKIEESSKVIAAQKYPEN